MITATQKNVLTEAILLRDGRDATLILKLVLVLVGIGLLVLSSKIKIPMIPVPMTMSTFAVLSIGAVYGPRLGLVTIIGYMLAGALGFDVFAGSSAEKFGISYMTGSTGGYLVGYVLAVAFIGWAARQGWDRLFFKMAAAMFIGNIIIYVPGLILVGYSIRLEPTNFSMGTYSLFDWRPSEVRIGSSRITGHLEIDG